MTWESILKVKSMSQRAKNLVDEVIDETPRDIKEILDLMYEKVEERPMARSGRNLIPTTKELETYLFHNYQSMRISNITGREIKRTNKNGKTLYFR